MAARLTEPDQSHRRYASLEHAGQYLGASTRTIRRMIARGDLAGYRIAGSRLLRVDLDELDAALRPIPTAGGDVAC